MPLTIEEHAQEIKDRGYTIVPNILDPAAVAEAREILEAIFEREKEIGPKRGWHNSMYKVAYMLPQKHPFFLAFPMNPRLLALVRAVLGKDCMLGSLNGLTMNPGGQNQKLHGDHPRTPFNVLTINALHCLDDFTRENGGTRLVPGSQDEPYDPAVDAREKDAIYIEAPAGSLLAYNGGMLHAGSANRTNRPRRAIHAFYTRSWVKPHWDYSKSLTADVIAAMSAEQRALYGIDRHVPYYDSKIDAIVRNNRPEMMHKPERAKTKSDA